MILRLSKVACVAAIALFASLVAFGNITDYDTNWAFVQHVLRMDTVFPDLTIRYRSIDSVTFQKISYFAIISADTLTAVLCWFGAARLLVAIGGDARSFQQSKTFAILGLTCGFLVWQVGFQSIGGEWFGMW